MHDLERRFAAAALSDVIVLVVSGVEEEFEAGLTEDGSIQDIGLLAFIKGYKHLVVCIDKMDDE